METAKPKRAKTGGRASGTANKATKLARDAIASFVDANAHRLANWLDRIEEQDGPRAAYQCFIDVVEYHVPKLSRAEIKADVTVKSAMQDLAELNAVASSVE